MCACACIYIYTRSHIYTQKIYLHKFIFSPISCGPLINTVNFYYISTSSVWKVTLRSTDFIKHLLWTLDCWCQVWFYRYRVCNLNSVIFLKYKSVPEEAILSLAKISSVKKQMLSGDSYIAYLLCGLFWMPVFSFFYFSKVSHCRLAETGKLGFLE